MKLSVVCLSQASARWRDGRYDQLNNFIRLHTVTLEQKPEIIIHWQEFNSKRWANQNSDRRVASSGQGLICSEPRMQACGYGSCWLTTSQWRFSRPQGAADTSLGPAEERIQPTTKTDMITLLLEEHRNRNFLLSWSSHPISFTKQTVSCILKYRLNYLPACTSTPGPITFLKLLM